MTPCHDRCDGQRHYMFEPDVNAWDSAGACPRIRELCTDCLQPGVGVDGYCDRCAGRTGEAA